MSGARRRPGWRTAARARAAADARAWALLGALGACATAPPIDEAEVRAILDRQAEAWNRGDLPGFMAGYWQSEELTFVGAAGVQRGYDNVLARYLASYPDAAARGVLSFEILDLRPLGGGAALLIGEYRLARAEPDRGTFTLVLERRPEGVRIVHDHTSGAAESNGT